MSKKGSIQICLQLIPLSSDEYEALTYTSLVVQYLNEEHTLTAYFELDTDQVGIIISLGVLLKIVLLPVCLRRIRDFNLEKEGYDGPIRCSEDRIGERVAPEPACRPHRSVAACLPVPGGIVCTDR